MGLERPAAAHKKRRAARAGLPSAGGDTRAEQEGVTPRDLPCTKDRCVLFLSHSRAAAAQDDVLAVPAPPIRALGGVAPDDETLVRRALQGDRWAEEALYRRHVHAITGVVAHLLRHGPDIEDVVQDVFVEGLRDLSKLREPAKLGAWLRQVAVHRVHKTFRRRRLRRMLGLDRSLDHDEPLAEQVLASAGQEARAELALLDAVLDAMRDVDRVCFVLRVIEDHPLAEIAELTGASLATVKRRLARAQAVVDKHREER